jgi:hypothetical protein
MYRTLGGYDFRTNPPGQANQPVDAAPSFEELPVRHPDPFRALRFPRGR